MIKEINPVGSMDQLSQLEADQLKNSVSSDLYRLYRNCSLAVLNSGSKTDSSVELLEKFENFDINVLRRERGVKLELHNPPQSAFVDGKLIKQIRENMFSVLRDIVYAKLQLTLPNTAHIKGLTESAKITNQIFSILRNAGSLHTGEEPNLVVCWGGHSINSEEYKYTQDVGHELGLRGLNICTGCGPGAMEGPMRGAAIGHAKQKNKNSRFIGLTEPSIIAAEPPNPVVNELLIMPDIEKRLEAFLRIGHGIIIFPGGPGTAEELLYILGILMHSENRGQPMPVILTGPKECEEYFNEIDNFIGTTLGREAQNYYQIIVGDAQRVSSKMKESMEKVKRYRLETSDAYNFNWSLKIEPQFQSPFLPTHENMANLNLHFEQPIEELAANLRCAFSGIVAGNVKDEGISAIKKHGSYKIDGDPQIMKAMDELLQNYVNHHRMKLPGTKYEPCYEIITE